MTKTKRKPRKKKNKGGRPKTEINWTQFDMLCTLHCTQVEIAGFFDCTVDTIQNHCKKKWKMGFSEYYDKKSSAGKIALRRKQMELAGLTEGTKHRPGDKTMLIWLGKNMIGQKDRHETDLSDKTVESLTDFMARIMEQ